MTDNEKPGGSSTNPPSPPSAPAAPPPANTATAPSNVPPTAKAPAATEPTKAGAPAAAVKPPPPAKPAAPARGKGPPPPPEVADFLSRRRMFINFGWASIAAFFAGLGVVVARFFFPRALFEPPTVFKAGFPNEYTPGTVNTNYQKSNRVWIVRDNKGIYALYAKCTHLGCTPVWRDSDNKFKCPCHGSGFTREGINYEGPAPRPLERVQVGLADDGQLLINTAVTFKFEKGQWDDSRSFLKLG